MIPALFRQREPEPQACHNCHARYAGIRCPSCRELRPAYLALTNEAARRRSDGVQAVAKPLPPCRYKPDALCDCGQRGECVEVA